MKAAGVAIAVFFTSCLAVLGACDGADKEPAPTDSPGASPTATEESSPTSPSPSPTPPAATRAELEALLKSMALKAQDLPSGFSLLNEEFTTNEEKAEEASLLTSVHPTLEDLNRFGRLLGYEMGYGRDAPLYEILFNGGTYIVEVATTVYQDSAAAHEAFEFVRRQASDPASPEAFVEGFLALRSPGSVPVSRMPVAELGDDRLASEFRFTEYSPEHGRDVALVLQIVGIQRGRGLGLVVLTAIDSPPPGQLDGLARKLDQRMKEALQ